MQLARIALAATAVAAYLAAPTEAAVDGIVTLDNNNAAVTFGEGENSALARDADGNLVLSNTDGDLHLKPGDGNVHMNGALSVTKTLKIGQKGDKACDAAATGTLAFEPTEDPSSEDDILYFCDGTAWKQVNTVSTSPS